MSERGSVQYSVPTLIESTCSEYSCNRPLQSTRLSRTARSTGAPKWAEVQAAARFAAVRMFTVAIPELNSSSVTSSRYFHISRFIRVFSVCRCTAWFTLYNVHCTVYIVHCTLYTVHCKLYIVNCTLHIVHCTLYIIYCTLYIVHCTVYNVHYTMYTIQCTLYTVH